MRRRSRAISSDHLPTPLDGERFDTYIQRFCSTDSVLRLHDTLIKRVTAAEREWAAAKERSLVSVTTNGEQFLLFGSLDGPDAEKNNGN